MATAFKSKSRSAWEEAKKLRDDPVLGELERASQEAKRKLSSSGGSSLSSSVGPDDSQSFRQRSQQSWRKQHHELVEEAAHIGERKASSHGKENSETSLAKKLLRRGYGLGPSQVKADSAQAGVATGGFAGAAKDEGSSIPHDPKAAFKDRLVKFYTKYNPSKLGGVDRTLETYSGREEELFQKLHDLYVADAGLSLQERKKKFITKETDPTVYMDISIAGAPAGRIVMRLLKDEIPLASENFRCLCTGEKVYTLLSGVWEQITIDYV
ncbi:unnamed protein product [Phytophthora lilii]|uniref:Unnamed protein product n=1 Tax=Phytophthora lilii TaxID=2077276 RepID=A0A9W6U2E9_9STRA|nr:unnamed protein product [Phytophthora lilii]